MKIEEMFKHRDEYLSFYRERGLTILPLVQDSKRPKVDGWPWATREELADAFSPGDNIGLRIEAPLFVVDVDDMRMVRLIEDETPATWMVRTRRGIHFYFKATRYYPRTVKRSRLVQLLAEGCQVVAPPSIVDGHEYKFLVDPRETPIAELDEDKVRLLETIIDVIAKHEKIIVEFAGLWTEGHRHNLSLWLNGALRKAGISRFEAAVIVKAICLLAGDPELKDRLRALDDTYKKPIEEVAAWSRLRNELQQIIGHEETEKILSLLPSPPEHDENRRGERRVKILSWPFQAG